MPSFSHQFFYRSALLLRKGLDMRISNVPFLRTLADSSSLGLGASWNVTVKPVKVSGINSEWLVPKAAEPGRVLLYLHGGGYAVGSLRTHRALVSRLAYQNNLRALHIDYRLAPEHPFPAALEDSIHAYYWLVDQGYDPKQIVIAGDSAGGGLAMAMLLMLKELGRPLPSACVCLSPWVDLTLSGASVQTFAKADPIVPVPELVDWAKAYAGSYSITHPMLSPLLGDLSGLPPILIQASTREVLTDDAVRLHQKILEAGGDVTLQLYPDMLHVWQIMWRYVPESREALKDIHRFLGEVKDMTSPVTTPAKSSKAPSLSPSRG